LGEVHHAPGSADGATGPARAVHCGCWKALFRHAGLDGGLPRGERGVRCDSGDDLGWQLLCWIGQVEDVHLGPEPPGKSFGGSGEGEVGMAGQLAELAE